jgi:oligoendopeptidase F
MAKTVLKRSEVDPKLTWDLKALFATEAEFETRFEDLPPLAQSLHATYFGKLTDAAAVNGVIDALQRILEGGVLVGTYASLSVSTDQTDPVAQQRAGKVRSVMAGVYAMLSFIDNEISALPASVIEAAMKARPDQAHYLSEILRGKPYLLSAEGEKILASLSPILESPFQIYSQAKLADLQFEPFEATGTKHPLSFVLFEGEWEFENDSVVRRAAFAAFSAQLAKYQHTMAATYQAQLAKEKILSTLRGYPSVIDYLLFDQQVTPDLYRRQIDVILEKLAQPMRKYAALLKRIHKLDRMTFADLKLAVDPEFEPKISVDDAKDYLLKGLSVLGDEYGTMLNRAFDEHWIDFPQNIGKSTGAFCSSPYGSHPYILISWTQRMRECFVLAHELGHAGHFHLANAHQSVLNTRPSLYFIEAPSTMNEMLMANYLMKTSDNPRMKRWVLSTMISRTYYHNFVTHLLEAAYQREVYRIIDAGGSVVASTLNRIMRQVLESFWGDDITITEGAELTWMRQLHYYRGLYPYTYSAGLTIATVVSQRTIDDPSIIEKWKDVLKAGGTKTPVELAAMVDVDITTDQPLNETIDRISAMIDEIIAITDQIEQENA